MRALAVGLAALLAASVAADETKPPQQPYQNPFYRPKVRPYLPPRPKAPDMCGPGYYCDGPCGMIYGPNYCVRPCFPPFNGLLPTPMQKQPRTPEEYQEMVRRQQQLMAPQQGLPPLPASPGAKQYPNLRPGAAPPGPYAQPAPPGNYPPGYAPPGVGPYGIATFPVHPFARSPRDFFMVGDPW